MAASTDHLSTVLRYHDETKHLPGRFARSLGYLDWANQPHPFRRYRGSHMVVLPRVQAPAADPCVTYRDLLNPGPRQAEPVDLENLGEFFRYGLGLSAWKRFGEEKWALRVNPSSGNLHPTEGYAVLGACGGVSAEPGVYHYAPEVHALEVRCRFSGAAWERFAADLPHGSFLTGLTSVHWRESWKYGERAFRYCQHDLGHAIASLRISAAILGWSLRVLPMWSDAAVEGVLGIARDEDFGESEREAPGCVAVVGPLVPAFEMPLPEPDELVSVIAMGQWEGTANRLSPSHVEWPLIDEVAAATRRSPGDVGTAGLDLDWHAVGLESDGSAVQSSPAASARGLVLQRRSAQALDSDATCPFRDFQSFVTRIMPGAGPPWDALSWPPLLHIAFFVHRVQDFSPGLYLLARRRDALPALRAALNPRFSWSKPSGLPGELDMFLLAEGDARRIAAALSCTQAIAGDGFFSLGMIAEFERPLREYGPWFYRRLFWESGVIGQALYLDAEAHNARGTGIGCFFDDAVHDVLGLEGREFQSLYHFTIGRPLDDRRLTTLPGYPWESTAPVRQESNAG